MIGIDIHLINEIVEWMSETKFKIPKNQINMKKINRINMRADFKLLN